MKCMEAYTWSFVSNRNQHCILPFTGRVHCRAWLENDGVQNNSDMLPLALPFYMHIFCDLNVAVFFYSLLLDKNWMETLQCPKWENQWQWPDSQTESRAQADESFRNHFRNHFQNYFQTDFRTDFRNNLWTDFRIIKTSHTYFHWVSTEIYQTNTHNAVFRGVVSRYNRW